MSSPDNSPTAAFEPRPDPPPGGTFARDLTDLDTLGASAAAGSGPPAVPGFEIVRELGRGGMGVVYLARQVRLNREVALKMVLAGGHASPTELVRFLAEAEAAYFALEYCPGGSLAQRLSGTPLPARDAAELVEQVARGVQAAHDRGIVHRDLKPANVLLAGSGVQDSGLWESNAASSPSAPNPDSRLLTPKVTDFGLARRADSQAGVTATGAILGSPSYMAPEQARAKSGEIGPRTDVYGLGAVLYECLTGRPPLRAATPMETLMQVLTQEPPAPRLLQPTLPRDLETICLKCLQKDPAKRYAGAAELADDLRRFLDGRPITARPVPWWERAWKAARRHPAVAASLVVVVLAVGAVFAVVGWKNAELRVALDAARRAEQDAMEQRDAAREAAARADRERRQANELRLVAEVNRETIGTLKRNVEKALEISEEEGKKAQARLDTALAAVDRMMVRVAGERWAANPALQQERKAVLEEAIALYRGLLDTESKDPRVRRQTAAVQMQVAALCLALADYPGCRKAAEAAAGLYRGLAAESPKDPAPVRGEADATGLLGFVAVLNADYEGSRLHYERAVELAERAVALDPSSADSLLTLTECLTALGHRYSLQAPARTAKLHARALEVAAGLGEKPGAPFEHRLAYADALVNVAVLDLNRNPPGPGREKLDRAGALFDQLARERPPGARAAERLAQNRAHWAVLQGKALFQAGRRDDGLRLFAEGLAGFDRAAHSDLLRQAGRPAEARKALDAFAAAQDALARDYPDLFWMKGIEAVHRSLWIVERVRGGECPDPQAEFDAFLPAVLPYQAPTVRYNLACALAQLARVGPADDRDKHAAKAVAVLNELIDGPFFRQPARVALLEKDADLDPLRDRDDFKRFVERAKAQPGKKP